MRYMSSRDQEGNFPRSPQTPMQIMNFFEVNCPPPTRVPVGVRRIQKTRRCCCLGMKNHKAHPKEAEWAPTPGSLPGGYLDRLQEAKRAVVSNCRLLSKRARTHRKGQYAQMGGRLTSLTSRAWDVPI